MLWESEAKRKWQYVARETEFNVLNLQKILNSINSDIQKLSGEADSLLEKARLTAHESHLYKDAAEKYLELVNKYLELLKKYDEYPQYLNINEGFTGSLINANLFHEKYDTNRCYGQYYMVEYKFTQAIDYLFSASEDLKKSISHLRIVQNIPSLMCEIKEAVDYDFIKWNFDILIIESLLAYNQSCVDRLNLNFASSYDNIQKVIDLNIKMYETTATKMDYFSPEDQRIYKAQVEAMTSNLFNINSLQSSIEYQKNSNSDIFFDIIIFLLKSYDYTDKAIQINNFWIDYKTVRTNIYEEIKLLLKPNKSIWKSLLEKGLDYKILNIVMQEIDDKYYRKITTKGWKIELNIFKNKIKTKGNVVVNNGNNNTTFADNNYILAGSDKEKLTNYIEYIKFHKPDDISLSECNNIIHYLNCILSSNDINQQSENIEAWKNLKNNLTSSCLKFLSVSSDIVTIGTFLKILLGL